MALHDVYLSAEAYMVCLTHALSTEKEEIMGLLIGETDERRGCHISAVSMLRRSDKRPDRVEISPEQLSAAAVEAERLAEETGKPLRVVGWYHSHPHITALPSHVDLRTQADYQLMDEGFVGLIFSVFNHDKKTKVQRMQLTCFQSINQSPEGEPPQFMRLEIPVHVVQQETLQSPCLRTLVDLPRILCQEEDEAYDRTTQTSDLDLITRIHNASVYTKSLCDMMEVMGGPLLQSLENRLENNRRKLTELKAERDALIKQERDSQSSSPSQSTDT